MSGSHPIQLWAFANDRPLSELAKAAECSESHLRNLIAGRKDASLRLAKRLSGVTGGEVPMDAFLRPKEAAE